MQEVKAERGDTDGGSQADSLVDAEVRKLTLADTVYLILLRRIVLNTYGAGDKLPSEQVLCDELAVSRPILRRALDRLRDDHLVVSRRGSGSYVTLRPSGNAPRFASISTIADLQCSYEFRLAVEPQAASLAALRHDAAMIERLDIAYETLDRAISTNQGYAPADFAFHLAVAKASNNHYFASTMAAMEGHISLGMRMLGTDMASNPVIVRSQHRFILDAIRGGDPDVACKAMSTHIAYSRNRLFDGRMLDLSARSGDVDRWAETQMGGIDAAGEGTASS